MNPLAKLLAIALAWPFPSPPSGYEREPEPDYKDRVTTIVNAITSATSDPDEAAALLVLSRDESTFDRWIHAGLKHPDPNKHQDHGRARCVLQIHKSRLVPEWDELAGTDLESTVKCMRAGLRLLRGAAGFCRASLHSREGMERALSLYATGKSCLPIALAKARTARWDRVRDALRGRAKPAPSTEPPKQSKPGARAAAAPARDPRVERDARRHSHEKCEWPRSERGDRPGHRKQRSRGLHAQRLSREPFDGSFVCARSA